MLFVKWHMKNKTIILLSLLCTCITSLRAQQDQVRKYLDKAIELIDQRDYENGVVICTYAIKADSTLSDAFYLRGLCFNKIGNQQAALRDLDFSLKLNPAQSEVFLLRSKVHQSLGNIKQSLSDINKARSLDPVGTTVHFARRFFKSILP